METKRCAYCHKLQRADAQACSRCGQTFVPQKSRPSNRKWTKPSLPPASAHQAGHYSGLHPEDQPYQSSQIAIQRPPTPDIERWYAPQHEPQHIVLPAADPESDPPVNQRTSLSTTYDNLAVENLPVGIEPPPSMPKKRLLPRRSILILLTLSCIFLLLASSIFAFVLIGRSSSPAVPTVTASPTQLRTNDTFTLTGSGFGVRSLMIFTYDINKTILDGNKNPLEAHTNGQGAFTVQIQIPGDWEPGQHFIHATDESQKLSVSATITVQQPPVALPELQVSANNLNFNADAPGIVSDKTISLINAGGGQISWQGNSDQAWLTASPGSDTFSGRESVRITVNRWTLAPQTYSGHITFTPTNSTGASPVIVTVTMVVMEAASEDQVVLPPSLSFTMVAGQQPQYKAIILNNKSSRSLDWTASATTADQGNWLRADPGSGSLGAGVEGYMNARVDATGLKPGSYQGTITVNMGGATGQVAISLTVS